MVERVYGFIRPDFKLSITFTHRQCRDNTPTLYDMRLFVYLCMCVCTRVCVCVCVLRSPPNSQHSDQGTCRSR